MSIEYEKEYLERKKKIVINYVNQFKTEHSDNAFPFKSNKNTLDFEESFCNSEICRICRGNCCRRGPCIFSPYDFIDICDIDYMKSILDTGLVCISRLPENQEILVLRPRGIQDSKSIFSNTSKFNPCILLDIQGCSLPVQYRPSQGLLYVPNEDSGLIRHSVIYSSDICVDDYRNFQDVLKTLICEYSGKSVSYCGDTMEENVNSLVKKLINCDK